MTTDWRASSYRRYVLLLLVIIQACNGLDGLALGLGVQSIKHDLGLTDGEVGFLSGIAFAAFYALMGVPIARWADRGHRVQVIGFTTLLFSILVSLCGLARSFAQLLLIRIGVAIGEAGGVPASQSLIAEYYERGERPRALAIYMLGGNLAIAIGYFVAGRLIDSVGWRNTFLCIGLPAVLPALLALVSVIEPRATGRERDSGSPGRADATPSRLLEVLAHLWRIPTFRHLLIAFSIFYFFGFGIQQWMPAFFIRSFGMSTHEVGSWLALLVGCGGFVGTWSGGVIASRFAADDETRQLRAMALVFVGFGVAFAGVFLSTTKSGALALVAIAVIGGATINGPLFATIQTLVPPPMRATALAIIYLCANLIGMGLGPLAAGMLSDGLRGAAGEESLRYALLSLCPGYLWLAWHLKRAAQTVRQDMARSV